MRLITDMDAIDSYVKTLYDIWMDKKESPRERKVCRQAHITIRRLEILWTKDKSKICFSRVINRNIVCISVYCVWTKYNNFILLIISIFISNNNIYRFRPLHNT